MAGVIHSATQSEAGLDRARFPHAGAPAADATCYTVSMPYSADGNTFVLAILGGVGPALIWLWFFLKEDSARPEPRWLIVAAFLAGMVAVLIALPLEMIGKCLATGLWPVHPWDDLFSTARTCGALPNTSPIILWAATEELVKYFMAVTVILWRRAVDEPIDAMIYLLTVGLGFAALETGLFLLNPLGHGDIAQTILTGDWRFIGAALVHTVSSATVGFFIAIAFYRSYWVQFMSLCTGLVLAIVLHALFNHNIIVNSGDQTATAIVFFFVWTSVVVLLLLFERAKRIIRPNT